MKMTPEQLQQHLDIQQQKLERQKAADVERAERSARQKEKLELKKVEMALKEARTKEKLALREREMALKEKATQQRFESRQEVILDKQAGRALRLVLRPGVKVLCPDDRIIILSHKNPENPNLWEGRYTPETCPPGFENNTNCGILVQYMRPLP